MRKRLADLKDQLENKVKERVRAAFDAAAEKAGAFASDASAKATEPSDALRAPTRQQDDLVAGEDEPPVVARLIVEIRSDGTRTVARGALKDELSGEQVSLVAKGNSPLELAAQLTRALVTAPLTAGQLAKAMLQKNRSGRKDES